MKHIDLENDTLAPVYRIAQERFGTRPSPATVWRWVRKGCRGVKLEAVSFGGSWHTTARAFAAFVEERTALSLQDGASEQHSRIDDVTDDMLRSVGLL